jgi:hypothetical protein
MPPRILVGTSEIAKYVHNLTKGFRELGFEADSLVLPEGRNKFYPDIEYTLKAPQFLEDTTYFRKNNGSVGIRTSRAFADFVKRYDIFVFFAGTSLLPRMIDLPTLKSMGKTIISRHCGSEVRDTELARIFWKDHDNEYPLYQRDSALKKPACASEYDIFSLSRYYASLANKLHTIRMAERHSDMVVSGAPSQTLGIRPYFQTGPIFDLREFSFRIPRRTVPVILHAPSSMEFKKTPLILKALDELRNEGVAFHLELLNGVPHQEVRSKLTEADILIDQLSCGCGTLAYEGMASGCVVLGGHKDSASPLPRNRPIVHITAKSIKERLHEVISNVRLRTRLAVDGREYINGGYGSPASVAQYMLDALARDRVGDADLYPTLFAERAFIPAGEHIPKYLRELSLTILQRHGTHPDIDLERLANSGLLPDFSESALAAISKWDVSRLKAEGPWVLSGPNATYGMPRHS